MATFKFTGEEQVEFKILPEGDYIFETLSRKMGTHSTTTKVNGFEYAEIRFKLSDKDGKPAAIWTETFTFHPDYERYFGYYLVAADFKVNGQRPPENYEMDPSSIDIIGLRGWCKVKIRKYKDKQNLEKETNQIAVWYSDKPKLPRAIPAAPKTSVSKIDEADIPPRVNNVEIPDDLR